MAASRGIKVTNNLPSAMGEILDSLDRFRDKVQAAERSAAATATQVSRTTFKRKRVVAPPRIGRHGRQQMARTVQWQALPDGRVGVNYGKLNREQPHWIIQELGTGKRAVIRAGGRPRPVGRPSKGATYVRTVKSQRGRRLSNSLVWAQGGRYVPPGPPRRQQLMYRRRVTGYPSRGYVPSIRIRREIEGQHFVQKGGEAGFREFHKDLAAARLQLKRTP